MDEVDETFLLNCIESKTTAHGRRGDQVMYTGRRVKKRDFVKIVNYHRLQRNLQQQCTIDQSHTKQTHCRLNVILG